MYPRDDRSPSSPSDGQRSASAPDREGSGCPSDDPGLGGALGRERSAGPSEARAPATALARAAAGAAMAGYVLPGLAFYSRTLRAGLGVEDRTASGAGGALTFDDGPHAQGTPAVLEVLASRGVRATFFLVGEQILRNPSIPAEIVAAGHEIGLHCHRHRNLLRLAPWQVREDIERAQATIEDATGISPTLYRPPYGILNATALRIARRAGRRTLLWTHWGGDWRARATPESISALVTDRLEGGSILLLHDADDYSAPDSWRRTALALPRVLDVLSERGIEPTML